MDATIDRLEKMELHVSHLERQVEQLNEVVVEQTKTIERLKTQVGRLTNTMEGIEADRIKSTNPKPPHYQ
jgi:SlyX protein